MWFYTLLLKVPARSSFCRLHFTFYFWGCRFSYNVESVKLGLAPIYGTDLVFIFKQKNFFFFLHPEPQAGDKNLCHFLLLWVAFSHSPFKEGLPLVGIIFTQGLQFYLPASGGLMAKYPNLYGH